MSRGRTIVSCFLLCLLAFWAALHWQRNRQVRFQGKTAPEWFVEFRKARPLCRRSLVNPLLVPLLRTRGATNLMSQVTYYEDLNLLFFHPAADGLRNLGSNAVPFLEAEVKRRDGPFAKGYTALFQRLPVGVRRHVPEPPQPRDPVQRDAALALSLLGKNADSAIPALLEAYERAPAYSKSDYIKSLDRLHVPSAAFDAMLLRYRQTNVAAGVVTIKALRIRSLMSAQLLTNAVLQGSIPLEALNELMYHRSYVNMTLPALAASLKSSDQQVQESAVRVLRSFGSESVGALPELTETLKSKNDELRYQCVLTFEAMGAAALPAVPVLRQATNDSSTLVRSAAHRVLKLLSPGGSE